MKAAMTPERTLGSTMVKKVLSGGAAEADRGFLDGEIERGEAGADHAHHIGQHQQRMADQQRQEDRRVELRRRPIFSSEKPSTSSGTRIGRTNSVESQPGSWMR